MSIPSMLAGHFSNLGAVSCWSWYCRRVGCVGKQLAIKAHIVSSQNYLVLAQLRVLNFSNFQAGHKFPTVFYLALGGSFISYIYSAPPLKVLSSLILLLDPYEGLPSDQVNIFLQLKQNGWIGNFALGSSYISLPWCVIFFCFFLPELLSQTLINLLGYCAMYLLGL